MTFVHEHEDFSVLVDGAARAAGIARVLAEKDDWVTHTLWALQRAGLDLWFKGGTSLSRGHGLIQRFSEDIDLKVGPGRAEGLRAPTSWTSKSKGAIASRRAFSSWAALAAEIGVAFDATHPAFDPIADPARHAALARAHTAIGPMFWGPRPPLPQVLATLRTWLAAPDARPSA